jgi:hypothetical protein
MKRSNYVILAFITLAALCLISCKTSDATGQAELEKPPVEDGFVSLFNRTPMKGNAAYVGYELQILDNTDSIYKDLEPYQYHGSVYGIIPAKKGFLNPVGEWNSQEVYVRGEKIRITLNGTIIVDGNLQDASADGTMDGKEHPGLERSTGHIAFLGHGSLVWFRNIRIKEL